MKKLTSFLTAAVLLFGLPILAHTQGSFKGYMLVDYYTVLDHHDSEVKGQHGFWYAAYPGSDVKMIFMPTSLSGLNSSKEIYNER